jgi:hypothetical protein
MKTLSFLLVLALPVLGFAQGTSSGEANLQFLYPARILSLGGAPIADPNDVTASFANPACLASGKSLQVMFSQLQWIQDIQTQLLSTSLPLSVGTAAFAITSTSVGDIPIRDIPGPPLGSFGYHSTSFQLGYGIDLLPELSLGTSVKYLYDKLYVDEASGYAVDVGTLYRTPIEGLSLAGALTNLGQLNAFRTQKTDLPTKLGVGAYYSVTYSDVELGGALAFGHETAAGGMNQIAVGAEATYDKLLSIRVGYQSGYEIRGLSAGIGFHYSVVQVDYAYIPFSQGFGNANILTIGLNL